MRKRSLQSASLFGALIALTVGGCASNYGWQTEMATADFVESTHILGELVLSAPRSVVLSGEGLFRGWRELLLESGYSDSDIVDGSEATVWAFCYGHNSGVPLCAHQGHYLVHIPAEFREGLKFDEEGALDTPGDLVEIELVKTPSGKIAGKWVGVYRRSTEWDDCRIEWLNRSTASSVMATLGGVGPARAQWLECEYAADDGWIRRPVAGAPPPFEQFPVSEWIKLPAR